MNFITFIITAIILAAVITVVSNKFEQKQKEKLMDSRTVPINEITFTNDDEYKQAVINQMQSINKNLVEIQIQNDRQRMLLKDIHSVIMFIVFLMIITILIKWALTFTAVDKGNDIIQDMTSNYNTTSQTTVYIENDTENNNERQNTH